LLLLYSPAWTMVLRGQRIIRLSGGIVNSKNALCRCYRMGIQLATKMMFGQKKTGVAAPRLLVG
jgi:hypothetical protein